jgi:nuclear pore complex protein Nup107
MTRFFAHLCLYLQLIDITVSPLAIQIILEAYLQVLEARHYPYSTLLTSDELH